MTGDLRALLIAALSIGFFHTVIGPDHYVPFVMIGRARRWTRTRTLVVTFLCGLAHVLSSVVLGLLGIGFGVALARLQWIESIRGSLASWALIAFGLAYFVWGMKPVFRDRRHAHAHTHEDGHVHTHAHGHVEAHTHVHNGNVTPWVLFTIFILGPCEPLIPLLMYPAAKSSAAGLAAVTGVFAAATVSTMLVMTALASAGWNLLPLKTLEKYSHAVAGAVIFATGLVIRFLGL
jgi:nickel/cobalt transporter (NicO) family protein